MTGRVCEVHGEWSASGVCRWCEPAWNPVWPLYRPTVADLPIQSPVVLEWQHAALRWERVRCRWNAKANEVLWRDAEGRAYVWRAWLSQVDRAYRASLPEVPP